MRQGPSGRRPRGRHHGGGGHHNGGGSGGGGGGNTASVNPRDNRPRSAASLRHQTFDSNCTDVRVRGNAWQVNEKYQALARDAQASGDRVAAENYLQHAEHYYRIIEAINEATATEQRQRGPATAGGPAPSFGGQQPEVPSNYYGAPGAPTGQPPSGGESEGNAQQQSPQAEVQKRNQASPFFTQEEVEADEANSGNSDEPLAARR